MLTRRMTFCAVLLMTVVVLVANAAQVVVVNPKVAMFTASPQHAQVINYVMEVSTQVNPSVVVRTTDLGKPTPNSQNDVTVTLSRTGLVNNTNYVYNIVTNSPGGSTRSVSPSNPFVWVDPAEPASNLRAQ